MQPETFWTLFHDAAHWEFEIFLMILFDGLIFGLAWNFIKKHWKHHLERDQRENKPRIVSTRQRITSHDVLGSFGIDEADVVSWELTNDTLTVVLRKQP
jgi:hypothetical protein